MFDNFSRILGTPNEDVWPGVTNLQDWNEDFPVWPSLQISRFTSNMCDAGIDLCEVRTDRNIYLFEEKLRTSDHTGALKIVNFGF